MFVLRRNLSLVKLATWKHTLELLLCQILKHMKGRLCLVDRKLDSQPCFLSGTCSAISVLSLSPEITAMGTTANNKQDKLRTYGDAVSRAVGLAGWFRAAASTAGLPSRALGDSRCASLQAGLCDSALSPQHLGCSRMEKWEAGGPEAEVTSGIMEHCGGERATGRLRAAHGGCI